MAKMMPGRSAWLNTATLLFLPIALNCLTTQLSLSAFNEIVKPVLYSLYDLTVLHPPLTFTAEPFGLQ